MNTQRENIRRALDVGENINPSLQSSTKSSLSIMASSQKRINLISQLKSYQDQRKILSDKSNKGGITLSKSTFKYKETITKVHVDETTTTKTKYIQQQQQQKQQQQQQETKDDFFQDNETRYEQEGEFIDIVPVLPILVPKRIRHLYTGDKNNTSFKVGNKRPFSDQQDTTAEKQDTTIVEKKQKLSNRSKFFVPNAPAINIEMNEETKDFEKLLETKAKLAMLQTTQSLKAHQWNDPMMVAEYAGEIFAYLYDSEPKMMGDPTYASNLQHEVTWKMRSVLIDWVIEIHYLFQLLPETLFLAVNIIDRFLSQRTVVLGKLQLVGITSLFIATKFEEMKTPTMQDFLFMTDNAVKEDELIKAERFILQVLDFKLCYPNPMNFFRRVCTDELKCDIHTRTLAKYFMEIACIDHTFIGIRPSQIAAASLWLAKKMLAKGKWSNNYSKLAGYTPEELKSTVESMLDYLSQPVTHDAFFKKWSSLKLSKASIFVRDWINRYYIN